MTHMGFLALPRWTAWAEAREEVYAIKEVIQEHLKVIRTCLASRCIQQGRG